MAVVVVIEIVVVVVVIVVAVVVVVNVVVAAAAAAAIDALVTSPVAGLTARIKSRSNSKRALLTCELLQAHRDHHHHHHSDRARRNP